MSRIRILVEATNNQEYHDSFEYHIPFVIENLEYYSTYAAKGDEFSLFAIERNYYRALQKLKKTMFGEFDYYIYSPYYHLGFLYTTVVYPTLRTTFKDHNNVFIDLKDVYKYITWYGYVNQLKKIEVIPYNKEIVKELTNRNMQLIDLGISSNYTKEDALEAYKKRAYKKGIVDPED